MHLLLTKARQRGELSALRKCAIWRLREDEICSSLKEAWEVDKVNLSPRIVQSAVVSCLSPSAGNCRKGPGPANRNLTFLVSISSHLKGDRSLHGLVCQDVRSDCHHPVKNKCLFTSGDSCPVKVSSFLEQLAASICK